MTNMSINYHSLIILVNIVIFFVTILNLFKQADCRHRSAKQSTSKGQEFPWVVGISEGGPLVRASCSGSVITQEFILTAAHCQAEKKKGKYVSLKDPKRFYVRAGKEDMRISEPHEQNIQVAQWFRPPTYIYNGEPKSQVHDIALIKLAKPLKFNDRVSPICLPTTNDKFALQVGTKMTVTGWVKYCDKYGHPIFSDPLNHVEVPIRNSKECADKWLNYAPFDNDSQICAGEHKVNDNKRISDLNFCVINSGGPLAWHDKKSVPPKWKIQGVVNYGHESFYEQHGVHSKILHHLKWIRDTIKQHQTNSIHLPNDHCNVL